MEYATEVIAIIRDTVIIVVSLLSLLLIYLTYRKISAVFNSATRSVKRLEDIVSAFSDRVSAPASTVSGLVFGAGKMAEFVMGLSRNKRKGEH